MKLIKEMVKTFIIIFSALAVCVPSLALLLEAILKLDVLLGLLGIIYMSVVIPPGDRLIQKVLRW